MENMYALRQLTKRNGFTLGVLGRVSSASENDTDGVLLARNSKLDGVQPSFGTGHHDLGKIDSFVEQQDESFSLGVPEPDIVLQYLGTLGSENETCEQHTNKRKSFLPHSLDGGLERFGHDLVHDLFGCDGCRGVSSHSASVQPSVALSDSLVVLSCRKSANGVTVRESQDTDFRSRKEFLDNDLLAGISKLSVNQHRLEGSASFFRRGWDKDSFSPANPEALMTTPSGNPQVSR